MPIRKKIASQAERPSACGARTLPARADGRPANGRWMVKATKLAEIHRSTGARSCAYELALDPRICLAVRDSFRRYVYLSCPAFSGL